jgi:hypothetical protein
MPDTANGGVFLSTPRQSRQYAAFGNPLPAIGIRLHAIPPPPAPRSNVGPSPCRVSGRRARFFQLRRSLSANIGLGGRGGIRQSAPSIEVAARVSGIYSEAHATDRHRASERAERPAACREYGANFTSGRQKCVKRSTTCRREGECGKFWSSRVSVLSFSARQPRGVQPGFL